MTSAPTAHEDEAEIYLDASEAIVLFELLSRWCDQKTVHSPSAMCFESTAECAVLIVLQSLSDSSSPHSSTITMRY